MVDDRGGVEDTKLDAKAKDTKKIRGQKQPFRGQTLSRSRTGMLEAKDQGHKRKCSPKKKKRSSQKFFRRSPKKKKKKKVFTKIFQAISTIKRFPKNFSSTPQNFNNSKNSAVLEPRTGQFSRTRGLKAKDFKMYPRAQKRPRGLHLWLMTIAFLLLSFYLHKLNCRNTCHVAYLQNLSHRLHKRPASETT